MLSNQLVDDLSVAGVLDEDGTSRDVVSSDDLSSDWLGGVRNNLGSAVNDNDDLVG